MRSSSLRLKRPRTLDDAPPGLGAFESDLCSSRDWANLGYGPAGLIAELVLAKTVADYIRFRAVCVPWRRCSADPRAHGVLDRRFHPRGWIMLMLREKHRCAAANPQRFLNVGAANPHRFLNVGTGQCIQVLLPELADHRLLHSTTECLLVLLCRATNAIRLLNPLTRQVAELPPIATKLASEFRGDAPDNAGLADDDHTVVLYFSRMETLAFAKPGDEHWVLVRFKKLLVPTLSFQGRFYGVTTSSVMVVDTTGEEPRMVVAAKLAKPFGRMVDTVHLVEVCGELMLVHRKIRRIRDEDDDAEEEERFKRKYKVYRVDLDAGKTTPVHGGLGEHAVFIGLYRTVCVSPQVFPNVTANTVYPGLDLDLQDVNRTGYLPLYQQAHV